MASHLENPRESDPNAKREHGSRTQSEQEAAERDAQYRRLRALAQLVAEA